jgi:ribosomal-protein-serine acetyltransferase
MIVFPDYIKDGDIELIKLAPTFENARLCFELVDSDREYLRKWMTWVDNIKSPEDQFRNLEKRADSARGDYYIKYRGELVGAAGFVDVSAKHNYGEIGFFIAQNMQGHGIVSRAVKMLEKFFFDAGGNRIQICMDIDNLPSENIAKRLGYVYEGTHRGAFMLYGEPRDIQVYSKLKSEWIENA